MKIINILNYSFYFIVLEEPVRKRKHHFMFRSKSSDKSKEARGLPFTFYSNIFLFGSIFLRFVLFFLYSEAKSNGNVFGVALAQCVIDDDCRFQDESNPTSPPFITSASGTIRKESVDIAGTTTITTNDRRTSPSGSVSSTNDSGYSISPASPSSLQVNTLIKFEYFS